MSITPQTNIVVIGGGTGTSVVLSGLKKFDVSLSAIISMADTGGSTGRLRDEFGFQPVGDLRQGLAALAADSQSDWIRKVLLYRFNKGNGLEGHNLGNLVLTALQDITGSTSDALEVAAKIFRLKGNIYPVTTQNIQLVIEYEDGYVEIGEHILDHKHGGEKIVNLKTSPRATLYPKAESAIGNADIIVIGPGDLYGSILPALIVEGIKPAFANTKAKIVYVLNLMTKYTQTNGYHASHHIGEIEKRIGRSIDCVIVSNSPIPKIHQKRYASQNEFQVPDDIDPKKYSIIHEDLLKPTKVKGQKQDPVTRSFLRHDPEKLARVIMQLCER